MNKPRRKRLQEALDLLTQAKAIIEECTEEEQEAFDNLPESIQYGQQGERMEEILDILNEAQDSIDEISTNIEDEVINC